MRAKLLPTLALTGVTMLLGAGAAAAASPTITVQSPTGIATDAANVHATINPGGAPTYYQVQSGLTTTYSATTRLTKLSGTTSPRALSVKLTGLQPGTVYHYRFVALNKFGGAQSADHTFHTSGHPPADVATGGAQVLSDSSAAVNAVINPHGQKTQYYFQYIPLGTLNIVSTVEQTLPSTSTPQVVAATLSGLTPGSFFQFRAVAVHAGNGGNVTSAGAFSTFLTFPDPAHKFAPRIAAATSPHRALRRPFQLTTRGHLRSPSGIPAGDGCPQSGRVAVWEGHHRVASGIVVVGADCRFSTVTTVGRLPRLPHKRGARHQPVIVTLYLQFAGNGYVLPSRARPVRIQLGQ